MHMSQHWGQKQDTPTKQNQVAASTEKQSSIQAKASGLGLLDIPELVSLLGDDVHASSSRRLQALPAGSVSHWCSADAASRDCKGMSKLWEIGSRIASRAVKFMRPAGQTRVEEHLASALGKQQ